MKIIKPLILVCLMSTSALAAEKTCGESVKPVVNKPVKHVIKPAPVKTEVVVQKVTEPCCDKGKVEQDQAATQANQQQVVINLPPAVPPEQRKVYSPARRTVERKTTRTVHLVDPNRLFLLLGFAKTNFTATADCCRVRTSKDWKPDFGIGYMRDIKSFSIGAIVTTTPAAYLAVGFNW